MLRLPKRKTKVRNPWLPPVSQAYNLASSYELIPTDHCPPPHPPHTSLARLPADKTYLPFSTLASTVKECASKKSLLEGRLAHFLAVWRGFDCDRYMGNLLIDMYGKCGSLQDARSTFDKMVSRNLFSWNILLSAYTGCRCGEGALELFSLMLEQGTQADTCTFSNAIVASSILMSLLEGRHVHFAILNEGLELDAHLASALVSMYGKCGSLEDAREIFDSLPLKDGVSWNAMITAYSMHGCHFEALHLFQEMQFHGVKYAKVTFLSSLGACSNLMALLYGMLIHAIIVEQGFQFDLSISTALISMYSNCRSLEDAQCVFRNMSHHDLFSWSAMISVNAQHGEDEAALSLFSQMHQEGMKPDRVTLVSVLTACANQAALVQGQLIHANTLEFGIEFDCAIENSLVNMYGKCGSLSDTKHIFDNMNTRNVVSWTAMIEVQAYVGQAAESFKLFHEMQEENVGPNDVTFVNILSSCSHAGLIEEGCFLYKAMVTEYNIESTMEHYSSMIDLFGRAGRLAEADVFISEMSIEPNAVIWETLLSACRVHNDFDRGKQAAERAILLASKISSPYVLLSNIYSAEGKWDDAARIWKSMFERGTTGSQKPEGGFELWYD
ncbi:hypothetical protein GOP47_0002357 [Adiantum capillus-veneris]|uniref:Pentatricopeptide repeat-containing protein n=1 Tax=Adiantum capillus-veneris TaxID=13818 RepID=A0A9D4ZP46_ADICA|nr:hypothetical protein GOP47_0002357 [Adiantum capillus-veneris]